MVEKTKSIDIGGVKIGSGNPLALIAGPCVIESREACLGIAEQLAKLAADEQVPLVFKASYDKANRSSVNSFRGPGVEEGLDILAEVREKFSLPILTDVHSVEEVPLVGKVADVLQLPAFLCRQTDLAVALGESGKVVNIKKGQFLAPQDIRHVIAKVESTGNKQILLTERGAAFGYNNLVSDMRSLPILRSSGYPTVYDATHSVQLPGGKDDRSGGDARWVPYLARAAVATGCDAVFMETHVSPESGLCDKDSMIDFADLKELWKSLKQIDEIARG